MPEKQKNSKGFKLEYGNVFGEKDGYSVIILNKENVQFGRKMTAKCKEGNFYISLVGGPTRVLTSEKVIIGHMTKNGQWEGGRIEFDIHHKAMGVIYRKYENGEQVQSSTCRYNNDEWETASGKPLGRRVSDVSGARPKTNTRSETQRRFTLPRSPVIEGTESQVPNLTGKGNVYMSTPVQNIEIDRKSSFTSRPRVEEATEQFDSVDAKLINQLGLSHLVSRPGANVTVTRRTIETMNNVPTSSTMSSRFVQEDFGNIIGGRTVNIQRNQTSSNQQQTSNFTSTSTQDGTKIVVGGKTINIHGLQGGHTEQHVTEEVGEDGTIRRKVNITVKR